MKKQLLSVSLAIAVLVIQPAVPAFAKEQPSIKTEQSCDTIETDTSITVNPQKSLLALCLLIGDLIRWG